MSAPELMTNEQAMDRMIKGLCEAADATVANKNGLALMAGSVTKRSDLEDARKLFAQWIPEFRKVIRKLENADRLLLKALRSNRPGVRA